MPPPIPQNQVARAAQQQRRQQAREQLPLWQRLYDAEIRITMRSTVSAQAYDTKQSSNPPESQEPPGAFAGPSMLETGLGSIDHLTRPILNAIADLEQALDFDDGLSLGRETTTMISEEKDEELRVRWLGVHSRVVAEQAAHLGSQRTIERYRRDMGLRPVDGYPRTKQEAT